MRYFFKVFAISFIIFTMTMSAGLIFVTSKIDSAPAQDDFAGNPVELDEKDQSRINILLLGVDSLEGEGNEATRTDTMILFTLDPKTDTAAMISIPRDTRVKLRGRSGYTKINAANVYGGVDLSVKTVKELLGVPVHHYVKVDYQALFKTVDDIGGVEVDVPIRMKYDDPYATPQLHIDLQKGVQTLDGKKAMQFLRFRKGNRGYPSYPDQDLGRIQAQQAFMQSLLKKALSPTGILKVPDYIETLHMYVESDMKVNDMIKIAYKGKKVNADDITKVTFPGEPATIGGVAYYQPDMDEYDEIKAQLFPVE
ncbi:MAG: LytR family transcriptional regulator [Peptoclostridium sp.]|uniref:LCP family protein n=1 Tax=Peptoclostridium sp. TaxID=1904860 RepID=UPI00139CDCBB|nr:LCP family protein [Peptoclostridium sp.]MZQ76011.1 LytR family transcriptional regulator [Peptoclostridium sp.]